MGGWYLLVYSYSFNQLKIKILLTTYLLTISSNKRRALSKRRPLIGTAPLGIHIEIRAAIQ